MPEVDAVDHFIYVYDEAKIREAAAIADFSYEWSLQILTEMADMDFIYFSDQKSHQMFLWNGSPQELANYIGELTDAYYRAIE